VMPAILAMRRNAFDFTLIKQPAIFSASG
jgi:hypothetical protein